MTFGPPDTSIKIYPSQPPANEDSWQHGIPLGAGATNRHLIMFEPTFQTLCGIDNTGSAAAATYSRSVTTGFTYTESVSIGIETAVEVSVEFVKVSVKLSTTLSFSSQWSKSVTESVDFTVPAGQRAFLHQGTIVSRVLAYDGNSYQWEPETARCLTNSVTTTSDPLPVDNPS
jgi:hypothetical protein